MERKKGKIYWFVPVLVIGIIFVYYFWGWDIGAGLHKENTAYDIVELTNMVNDQIDSGKKSGVFYISGITEDELVNMNDYICIMNGVVEQYSILERGRNGMRVLLKYSISDNYYVCEKYLNGQDIPDDRPEAIKLYDKVEQILSDIITPDMRDYEKELAIHDYLVANCQYGYVDYSRDFAYQAYGALVQKQAVCNGYAEAMALLLTCVNIENEIMTGWADGELHSWNRVLLDGQWYQVDATWDDPVPDRGSFVGHMYFNVTDDIMDDSHVWDEEKFEPCESMDYNYFQLNDLICNYTEFQSAVKNAAAHDITATVEVVLTDYNESVYSYDFMQDIPGLMYFLRSKDVESYGPYHFITLYLNQKD